MKFSKVLTLIVVTLLAILAFSSCSYYIFGNDECEHKSTTTSTFAKATCSTEGLRRTICSECGTILRVEKIEKIAHKEVIDEAIEPTCSEYGRTEGKHCSVCDQVIVPRKVVAKKPHTVVIDRAVAATCIRLGLTEGKHCSVCNEVIVAPEVIEMKPHTVVIDQTVAATCISSGLTGGKHCSVCNEVIVAPEVIEMTPHTVVIDRAVAATCISSGLTEGKHCWYCNKIFVPQEIISAGDHRAGEWIIDAEATCTEDGSKHQICSLCEATIKTETISNLGGHSYQISSVENNGIVGSLAIYTCINCPNSYEGQVEEIAVSVRHSGTSSSTVNGYGSYSKFYSVFASGGYGEYQYKYEVYTSTTATKPIANLTQEFSDNDSYGISYTGYYNTISGYILQVTVKDEAGNQTIYRYEL